MHRTATLRTAASSSPAGDDSAGVRTPGPVEAPVAASAAGRPKHADRLGGFENWSEAVGGILQVNGLRAWRTNEGQWRKLANPHGSEMETFVEIWHEAFGASEVTALDLMNLAEQNGLFGFVFARNGIAARGSVFGKLLTRHINAPIGKWRIRQRKARQAIYRLEDAHGD